MEYMEQRKGKLNTNPIQSEISFSLRGAENNVDRSNGSAPLNVEDLQQVYGCFQDRLKILEKMPSWYEKF